jgi:predicted secreted hydrolase
MRLLCFEAFSTPAPRPQRSCGIDRQSTISRSCAAGVALTLLLIASCTVLGDAGQFSQALHPRAWSFPRDHGRHDGFKTEWWYFTGNLRDSTGRQFGYQITFFRSALTALATTRPSPWEFHDLYFAHAAVSDIATRKFHFADRLQRGRPGLAWASDKTMDVVLADWSGKMDAAGRIEMHVGDDGFAIDLNCDPGRGPILQGPGGVNTKGHEPGEASYYYSMTRLPTHGTLRVGSQTFAVTGQSWMDHEFSSNALDKNQVGWDWMGLDLSDGNDLMVYRMRTAEGSSDYLSGTVITPDGKARYLSSADLSFAGSDIWKSPDSGGAYPQTWKLSVAGLGTFTVKSLMPGQELITSRTSDITYFEGAAEVLDDHGKPAGEGYLEMTGYAKPVGQ